MKVRAISVTRPLDPSLDPENLLAYCARVSSPQNQDNHATAPNLLTYCMNKKHWSVFDMADFTVEIETSVAVSRQLLRHKSFSFQEFSQRYADASQLGFEDIKCRMQDTKNRQNSLPVTEKHSSVEDWFSSQVQWVNREARYVYENALAMGVAKEVARMILPMCTTTRMYMKGSVRSFLTYFMVRLDKSTQLEHREVALAILEEFKKYFPVCAGLLEGEVK